MSKPELSSHPSAHAAESFHIAFCVDNNYCLAMGATIASIIANNPAQQFVFHVLAFDLVADNKARLQQLETMYPVKVQLHLLNLDDFAQFSHFLKHSHYSLSIFTRLVIPTVLRGQTDRVLYLDADILCVGALDELIALDISADIAVVVPDAPVTTRRRVAALKLAHASYFNGGVMLINIEQWIAHDITKATLDTLMNSGSELRFNDQDALNIVLNGRARYVSPRWNYLYDLIHDLNRNATAMRPVGRAVLIHFAGSVKPWLDWSNHDARLLFRKYHALSPWAALPLDPQPKNSKEMRMHSRFLFRQRQPLESLRWYLKYLMKRSRR
jgi:lipopolysaccharide biosynthesis glycosyltransferase